jgi:cell wall-associated NlpC family hydrolase
MTEEEFRKAIVDEALTWVDTPYNAYGRIKGVGVNCAYFLYGVAKNAKVIPEDAPFPSSYSPQFSQNVKEERLLGIIQSYGAIELLESQVKPGDIVVYKNGLSHVHAGIILDWPTSIIHVTGTSGCQMSHGMGGWLAPYHKVFRTLWHGNIHRQ